MSDADPSARGARAGILAVVNRPLVLWAAFLGVHVALAAQGLSGYGLGDVEHHYRVWVSHGLSTHHWVGLQDSWVYPIVALLPMIVAYSFGYASYSVTWLVVVTLVDAAGFAVMMGFGRDRRLIHVAWWWLGLLLLLGPVAVGRLDSITGPIAIVGLLCLANAPRLAGVLLAVATWIKVWPAALIVATFIAIRTRARFAVGALGASIAIIIVAVALGGGSNLLSFVSQETGRGLQVESCLATWWMWDAYAHPGETTIYDSLSIATHQLRGPGVATAAALATPLLAIAVAGLLVLGVVIARRGVSAAQLLPSLSLAITVALIVFNKVGSPQFVSWLAVPIVLGLSTAATGHGIRFRTPAILALVIAALTQVMFPVLYDQLLSLNVAMLLVLSARNLLYVALLVLAVLDLVKLLRSRDDLPATDQSDWLPRRRSLDLAPTPTGKLR